MVKMEPVSEMIGLKLESGLKLFFKILPCGKKVIFVNEFVVLGKNLPFYEVREKKFQHGEI